HIGQRHYRHTRCRHSSSGHVARHRRRSHHHLARSVERYARLIREPRADRGRLVREEPASDNVQRNVADRVDDPGRCRCRHERARHNRQTYVLRHAAYAVEAYTLTVEVSLAKRRAKRRVIAFKPQIEARGRIGDFSTCSETGVLAAVEQLEDARLGPFSYTASA